MTPTYAEVVAWLHAHAAEYGPAICRVACTTDSHDDGCPFHVAQLVAELEER